MESPDSDSTIEHDKYVEFYYTNVINSIVLFALNKDELVKLAAPTFDPMFELESEIDYAFTPVCFETVFRNGFIDRSFKQELLGFRQEAKNIPADIWDLDYLDSHPTWIHIRQIANALLDKLGINHRTYNDDFTTVHDSEGNIIKKGRKL